MPQTPDEQRFPIPENPLKPPDLMALVHQFDGYDKITPEAWAAYSEELRLYRRAIAQGDGWRMREAGKAGGAPGANDSE